MTDTERRTARWTRTPGTPPALWIDGHLDLAMNALLWNRDLTLEVDALREQERSSGVAGPGRGCNTVTLPELRGSGVGLSLATVLARTGGAPTPSLPRYATAEIAYVCELAGGTRHVAIGSDLDGGFGTEQTPRDLDTIADLQKLPPLLRARGFSEGDVEAVLHGNWLRLLESALPG